MVVNLTARTKPLNLQEVQFALQMHKMRLKHQTSYLPLNLAFPHSANTTFHRSGPGGHHSSQSHHGGGCGPFSSSSYNGCGGFGQRPIF